MVNKFALGLAALGLMASSAAALAEGGPRAGANPYNPSNPGYYAPRGYSYQPAQRYYDTDQFGSYSDPDVGYSGPRRAARNGGYYGPGSGYRGGYYGYGGAPMQNLPHNPDAK